MMEHTDIMALNAKQQEAFEAVKRGGNVFLSGQAGTGKSFTLKHIVAAAYKKWGGVEAVGVTATTGLAALLIGGRTVHSFLGIGLARKSAEELAKSVRKERPFVAKKLAGLRLLIIDEVSMMDAELLEKISVYLGLVRGVPDKPFGDVQLVVCGDLCQLPPVQGTFCFKAPCWKAAGIRTIMLTESIRQAEDGEFLAMLEALRFGKCSEEVLKRLEACGDTVFEGGIEPTVLYSKNVDVDAVNEREYLKVLERAGGKEAERSFVTRYTGGGGDRAKDWARSIRVADSVSLCVGAQVMVTWNVQVPVGSGGLQALAGVHNTINLPNGMRGVVVSFVEGSGDPIVRFRSGREIAIPAVTVLNEESKPAMSVTFMPLKLAYAITIHKSQGMTLDAVVMDLGDSIFQEGQAYTALSRARNLASVRIVGVKAQSFRVHPEVKAFYATT